VLGSTTEVPRRPSAGEGAGDRHVAHLGRVPEGRCLAPRKGLPTSHHSRRKASCAELRSGGPHSTVRYLAFGPHFGPEGPVTGSRVLLHWLREIGRRVRGMRRWAFRGGVGQHCWLAHWRSLQRCPRRA
jgi:hypothetical protein